MAEEKYTVGVIGGGRLGQHYIEVEVQREVIGLYGDRLVGNHIHWPKDVHEAIAFYRWAHFQVISSGHHQEVAGSLQKGSLYKGMVTDIYPGEIHFGGD